MNYNHSKKVTLNFEETIDRVTDELQKEGFSIITEIDLQEKFKMKLNINFRKYKILGACNPKLAYEAIMQEDKIGLLLPCNILVQEQEDGLVEVAAINPLVSIGSIENERLKAFASEVSQKLEAVINRIQ